MPQNVPNSAIGFDLEIEGVVKAKKKKSKSHSERIEIELNGLKASLPADFSQELQKQVKRYLGLLKWCAKTDQPVEVILEITIGKDGKVSLVKILKSDAEKYVEVCLVESIGRWQFAIPRADDQTVFQLPLKIKS